MCTMYIAASKLWKRVGIVESYCHDPFWGRYLVLSAYKKKYGFEVILPKDSNF